MGKFIKKLTAVLLVVATLASFVVPATFADAGTDGIINYDFQLVTNSQVTVGESDKYSKVSGTIKSAYDNGTHNWRLETSVSTVSTSGDMRFYGTNDNEGLRLMNLVAGEWIALRIKVAEAGNYEVALTGGNAKAHPYQATMYAIAAASADTMVAADIEAAMVSANQIGTVSVAEGSERSVAGEHVFDAGDNILIIALNPSGSRASIQDIDLTPKAGAPETTAPSEGTTAPAGEPVNLDFELYKDAAFSATITGAGDKLGKSSVKAAIEAAYAAGNHSWKLETVAEGVDTTVHTKFFSKSDEGLRLSIGAGKWIALRVKVAEAGNYEVSVKNNISTYGYKATLYSIAAPAETMTAAAIEAAMVNANLVGTADHTLGNTVAVAGEKEFAEGDNILIIAVDSDRAAIAAIDLTPKAASNVPTDPSEDTTAPAAQSVKFDFEVYNHTDVFSGAANANGYKYRNMAETAKTAYTNGTYNWHLEALADGLADNANLKFFAKNNEGLRFIDCNGKWVAFRVKVPEADSYELSITNNSTANGYKATVYALAAPADEMSAADVEAAMVSANLVGVANHTAGNTVAVAGIHTFAEGDNILIIAVDNARAAIASIDLIAKEPSGDTPEDTTAPEETTQPSVAVQDNVFDLELYNYDVFSSTVDGNYTKIGKFESTMNNAYPNDWNWKFEGFSADSVKSSIRVTTNRAIKFSGSIEEGYYIALRLNVTKAGKYDVVAKSIMTTNYYTAKTWLVPVTSEAMTPEALQAAMVDANALYDLSIAKDKMASNLGEYDFAVGEYVLIIAPSAADIYLSSIELANPGEYEKPTVDTRTEYENKPGYFDMRLFNYKGYDALAAGFIKYNRVEALINSNYPASLNWKLEAYSANLNIKDDIQFIGSKNEGLRASADDGVNGEWIALRLNNTKAGNYDLIVNSDVGIWSGKVYMIPATAEAMTADQIAAAMTDANLKGKVNFTSETDSYNLGEFTFEACEYIIVLQADKNRVTVDSIEIAEHYVEVPKDPVDKIIYDLDLVKMDPNFNDKGFTNWYSRKANGSGDKRVYTKIAEMYTDGSLNWKYETMSATATRFNCRKNHTQVKVSTNYSEIKNAWNAIRILAPGAGTYDVRLYSDELSSVIADIYLIPARTGIAMSNEQIEAAMTGENLLVANTMIDGKGTFYFGEYTFGPEYEYVMVFKFNRGKKMYFNNIQMTKDGLVADTEVKKLPSYNGVVYDFDIGDKYTGILQPLGEYRYDAPTPKEAGYASPYEQMKSFWNSGKINWKWIAASEDLAEYDDNMNQYPGEYIRFYQDTGMYIYSRPNSWVAFKIKSPGEGDFTLTMNHAVAANDGTVAVYILPADTPNEEIYNTTDPSNRVGKVVLTKPDGSAGKKDGYESFVGYWNFEAGKEYILVLEAYAASQFSASMSNMNITNIVMQKGIHEYKTEKAKTVKPITVKERVLATSDLGNGNVAIFEMNGMDYYLTQLEGGTINLYNLTTGELEKENYISTARPRHMAVAPDGKVWMTGAGKFLVCYDPQENTIEKTKTFMPKEYKHNGPSYMTITPEGVIYFTLNQRGNIIEYNPATKQFRDLGYFVDPLDYTHHIFYHEGYLYVTAKLGGSHNAVVKYNIANAQVEKVVNVLDQSEDSLTGLSMLGEDILVVGGKTRDNDHTIAFNIDTMEQVDLGLPGSVSKQVTSPINGKQYMILSSYGLYEYDVETKEITKTPGFSEMTGTGFRGGDQTSYGKSWAMINGDLCLLSNDSQVTSCPRVVNLDKKEYYRWTDLTRDAAGGGSRIISFTETEPGAGELVMGHWNAEFISTYNIYTGELSAMDSAGQTDSIGYYKGILYGGCYSATVLVELHRETEEIIQRFKLDHELTGQKRLLSMETGGDHVFVGSIPDSYQNGGALTVYNTITGQWYYERNIVPNQSIIDEAYSQELVFIASSLKAGDNAADAGDSAVIVAYDYLNRKALATLDPRDYIPGLASPVVYVYGLTADPNTEENGRIWAVVSDTLFCFTFDRETNKFDVQQILSLGKTNYNISSGVGRTQRKIRFIPEENQLYVMLSDTGMQKIVLEDWNAPIGQVKMKSYETLMGYKPEDYIIAEDGNFYFGNDANLMMIPLNVTDEDWAIAEKMDAEIQAIKDGEITLETESAIRTARANYENLSWRYKALVQKLELLQEAESDILECLIDEAILKAGEIDADDYPVMLELHEQYNGLTTARQKRYVKNYKALKEAYELSSQLNDEREAAAMQKKVNGLKDIMPIETLEKEPQVVAVRTKFEAMPGRQRILVDTTILEEAEAQIAVLRAELVKQVEALIQAIPAEITLEAEPAITAAREGVDKLTALERKQVSYSKLESSEAKLRNLKNAMAKAQEFDAMMKEIGIVTLGDAERIANARAAYNRLNETARAFCKKAGKLNRAEFILSGLQTWMIPVIAVVDAGAIFAVLWFVPSLHQKVFKGKKKEEEPAETE